LYDVFSVNLDPSEVEIDKSPIIDNITPLILKSEIAFVYGSMYTPSEIHPTIIESLDNFSENNTIKSSWRDGRVLDVERYGMPKSEGSYLLISKETLKEVKKGKTLMYKVTLNEQIIFIDYDNKRIYEGGIYGRLNKRRF
jgi:hypothetical protein